MNTRKGRIVVLVAILVMGCDPEATLESMIPHEEAKFAKEHIALYQARDFDQILSQLDPQVVNEDSLMALQRMADAIPTIEAEEIEIVGSHVNITPSSSTASLTFQYKFPDIYVIAAIAVVKKDARLMVSGANFHTAEASLQEINEFRPDGRGIFGYVFLGLAIFIPVFIVFSFIVCIRTPIPKRKWAWAIFVLLGMGVMSLNWTTGAFTYSVLTWQLLGAGFTKTIHGPLVLSIGTPIGAMLFWIRRKEWQRKTVNQDEI